MEWVIMTIWTLETSLHVRMRCWWEITSSMWAPKVCMEIWPPVLSLGPGHARFGAPKLVRENGFEWLDANGFWWILVWWTDCHFHGPCFHFFTFLEIGFRLSNMATWLCLMTRLRGGDWPADGGLHCWLGQWNATAGGSSTAKLLPVGPPLFICIRQQPFAVFLSFIAHDMARDIWPQPRMEVICIFHSPLSALVLGDDSGVGPAALSSSHDLGQRWRQWFYQKRPRSWSQKPWRVCRCSRALDAWPSGKTWKAGRFRRYTGSSG